MAPYSTITNIIINTIAILLLIVRPDRLRLSPDISRRPFPPSLVSILSFGKKLRNTINLLKVENYYHSTY